MRPQEAIQDKAREAEYPTSYHEMVIGDTLYCVTNVYKGEFHLKDALEDLVVRRVLREAMSDSGVL